MNTTTELLERLVTRGLMAGEHNLVLWQDCDLGQFHAALQSGVNPRYEFVATGLTPGAALIALDRLVDQNPEMVVRRRRMEIERLDRAMNEMSEQLGQLLQEEKATSA